MNYFEKHIGDWISDTVSLTMLEEGAYARLTDQCYQTEKPLSLDRKMVYRLARASTTAERKAVDFVVKTFFFEESDGFYQKRIRAEIERFREKQRKASASANARWSKCDGNANAYANASSTHDALAMRTHCEGNAHQTPVTSNHIKGKKKTSRAALKTPIPTDFGISEPVRVWAERSGHERLAERLEHFVGVSKARGYAYVDWDQAFQNAVRDDWAKLGQQPNGVAYDDRLEGAL